jgi:hypothetical protein
MRISRKALGIFVLSVLMGTLYAGLIGLIFRSQAAPVFSWPVWISLFWLAFYKFDLLRFSGFIAVLPVSLLAFEVVRSVRYPGTSADRHRSLDRSHFTPGLEAKNPKLSDHSNGPREILIGRDGFRADPETGRGNPERCRFVLIGDSMIYGTGLAYPLTLGPVLADMGLRPAFSVSQVIVPSITLRPWDTSQLELSPAPTWQFICTPIMTSSVCVDFLSE